MGQGVLGGVNVSGVVSGNAVGLVGLKRGDEVGLLGGPDGTGKRQDAVQLVLSGFG